MKLYNKKAEFNTKKFLISLIIIGVVVALSTMMFQSMAVDYGNEDIIDEDFKEHYDMSERTQDNVSEMFTVTSGEEGLSLVGTLTTVIKSLWSVITMIFSSLDVVKEQLKWVTDDFGVPLIVAKVIFPALLAILTLLILFAAINAINKTEKL